MQYPILIYDDMCTSCTAYAKLVNRLLRGKITMIGHYTNQGKNLKQKIFQDGYDGLEMSWFVTQDKAHGGRAGLIQLIKHIIFTAIILDHQDYPENNFDLNQCTTDCKTVKGVVIRSCSILTNSKIIEINQI